MTAGTKTTHFSDLSTLIDGVHQLFTQWEGRASKQDPLDPAILSSARIAVHEWIANLVQHADFQDRDPEISVSLAQKGGRLRCLVTDNSEGFDLEEQLALQRQALQPMPERGMGLIWIHSLAEEINYSRSPGYHSLEFFVSSESPACLDLTPNA